MYAQIKSIAVIVRGRINKESPSLEEFDKYIDQLSSPDTNKQTAGLHFLLKKTCEYNLINELHALLELKVLDNINQLIKFRENCPVFGLSQDNGKTLLGIAAFNGHQEMVRYLIEVQGADVNGVDWLGNTPLHQVVYGDSHPYNHTSNGLNHDLVVDDLLFRFSADPSVKNTRQVSAFEACARAKPFKIELLLSGKRLISSGVAYYYGDQVRPAIERKQAQIDWATRMNRGRRVDMVVLQDTSCNKQPFEQFRTDFAIEAYINRNLLTMGFKNPKDMVDSILRRPMAEWQHAVSIIDSIKPEPNSGNRFPNENNIRHGILTGLVIAAVTYYLLGSMEFSLSAGVVSAWLTMLASIRQTGAEQTQSRTNKMGRAMELQSFFKTGKSRTHSAPRSGELKEFTSEPSLETSFTPSSI